ncbi:MAG: Ref family protein [Pseudomonadota bacterium]|nr:Ref family protein [Pseudomonadota bacterium]
MKANVRDFAIRELGCTACFMDGVPYPVQCDKHHLNEGDQPGRKRRGEKFTVGLCGWHHVGTPFMFHTADECREAYGPSWHRNKVEFIQRYGDGDALLAVQNKRIEQWQTGTLGA